MLDSHVVKDTTSKKLYVDCFYTYLVKPFSKYACMYVVVCVHTLLQ